MSRARWAVLVLYTAAIFLSLPYTPRLVRWSNARFGPGAAIVAVAAVLAPGGCAASPPPAAAFARPSRWPHLALAGPRRSPRWAAWRLLASSPIGRVHLPEYGLLALLAARAFGGATRRGARRRWRPPPASACLDELVQGAHPGAGLRLVGRRAQRRGGAPRRPGLRLVALDRGRGRDAGAPPAPARPGRVLAAAMLLPAGWSRPCRCAPSRRSPASTARAAA